MEKETVKRIAQLSRLKLSDEQLSSVAEYLDEMQECVSVLNCADLIGVCQTVSTLPFNNVFRADQECESMEREEIIKNAPKSERGAFVVPKIME